MPTGFLVLSPPAPRYGGGGRAGPPARPSRRGARVDAGRRRSPAAPRDRSAARELPRSAVRRAAAPARCRPRGGRHGEAMAVPGGRDLGLCLRAATRGRRMLAAATMGCPPGTGPLIPRPALGGPGGPNRGSGRPPSSASLLKADPDARAAVQPLSQRASRRRWGPATRAQASTVAQTNPRCLGCPPQAIRGKCDRPLLVGAAAKLVAEHESAILEFLNRPWSQSGGGDLAANTTRTLDFGLGGAIVARQPVSPETS